MHRGCVSFRYRGPKTDADAEISLAKGWMNDCVQDHPACSQELISQLPTRVIMVGSIDGKHEPRLIQSEGQAGRYSFESLLG